MTSAVTSIRFVAGSRKLFAVSRRVQTIAFTVEDLLTGHIPPNLAIEGNSEGLRVLSAPATLLQEFERHFPRFLVGGLQHYRRHYIDMAGSFDDYLAKFSGRTRSTFKRKQRKLEEAAAGTLEIAAFRTVEEIDRFFDEALPLSRKTYQARLLDAGLPEDEEARENARKLALQDSLRAFLLRLGGKTIAYLYLPVEGQTLKYAHLGYDPHYRQYSPGTVLQLNALEHLFAEQRFRYFDFTEGEGAHKAQFGTDSIAACSFLLLRPSLANRLLLSSLNGFDQAVSLAKRLLNNISAGRARRIRRA